MAINFIIKYLFIPILIFQIVPHNFLVLASTSILKEEPQQDQEERVNEGHLREKRWSDKGQVEGFYGWSYKADATANVENLKKFVLEQNVRAIKSETEFMTNLDKGNYAEDPIYKLIQISRQIAGRVCEINLLDEHLLKSVSRLFRYILVERREANSYGFPGIDQAGSDRVMKLLGNCLREAEPWVASVGYVPVNCDKHVLATASPTRAPELNCTGPENEKLPACKCKGAALKTDEDCKCWNTPLIEECKCKPPNDKTQECLCRPPYEKTEGCAKNRVCQCERTIEGLAFNDTQNSTRSNLTDTLKWNYEKNDFIVETIWKLFQFTHHYCASHFSADGTDLSLYHERIERLFNSDIIFRWYNPGYMGHKIWDFFYFGYDLRWFAEAMDSCVAGAQSISAYTEFMSRPLIPTFRKKREVDDSLQVNNYNEKLQKKTQQ